MKIFSREIVKITISTQCLKITQKEKPDKNKSDITCKNMQISAVFPHVAISK